MEHWQVAVIVASAMIGLWGIFLRAMWKTDQKIARIYERLDDYKKLSDKVFVRKDMCDQTLKFNTDMYARLETRFNESFIELRASIKRIEDMVLELIKKGGN